MTTNYALDPKTMRMKAVADSGGASDEKPVYFPVDGELLQALLRYAKEDKLDMSNKQRRGTAVNSYVRAAIKLFIEMRESNNRKEDAAKEKGVQAEGRA